MDTFFLSFLSPMNVLSSGPSFPPSFSPSGAAAAPFSPSSHAAGLLQGRCGGSPSLFFWIRRGAVWTRRVPLTGDNFPFLFSALTVDGRELPFSLFWRDEQNRVRSPPFHTADLIRSSLSPLPSSPFLRGQPGDTPSPFLSIDTAGAIQSAPAAPSGRNRRTTLSSSSATKTPT